MGHGQSDRTASRDVLVAPGAVPETTSRSWTSPGVIDLCGAMDLMQEAALLLGWDADLPDPAVGDFRTRHVNRHARRTLRVTDPDPAHGLVDLMPVDTASELHRLCVTAVRTGRPVEHFAVAPDPVVDLCGTASIAVRVTRIDNTVLCTWVPGWHVTGEVEDRRSALTQGMPVADRLELAAALDALAGTGLGVFSFNLMTGRLIWSAELYQLFDRTHRDRPADMTEWLSLMQPDSGLSQAWQALVRDGVPVEVAAKLIPSLGGHPVRVVAYAVAGPDGYPAVVRGRCSVTGP